MEHLQSVTKLEDIKVIENFLLKIPGYVIELSKFSGISEVRKVLKKAKMEDEKEKGQVVYNVLVFFDGMMTHLSFMTKEQAEECRKRILDIIVKWHKNSDY